MKNQRINSKSRPYVLQSELSTFRYVVSGEKVFYDGVPLRMCFYDAVPSLETTYQKLDIICFEACVTFIKIKLIYIFLYI